MRPAWRHAVSATQWAAGAWLLAAIRTPGPRPPAAGGAPRRRVSVLIPARDEASSLPHLLASLAAQVEPPDEVVVVDDASTDGTGQLARRAGVRVLESSGPPAGWSGKCWALHQGQAAATGELLVFLDADVTLSADGLARIVAEHDRQGGNGIVSAEPYHRTVRPYEQLSAVANVVALMGTGAFGPLGSKSARDRPMAFGPCLAVDRATYDLIGGHAHPDVRSKITEDLAMARRARQAGRPVAVLAGGDAVAFRMYPGGLRQLVDGWTKVLATGAGGGPRWAAGLVAWWVTGAILAAVSGARAAGVACGLLRAGPSSPGEGAVTYVAWAAQMGWLFRRAGRFGPPTAAAFPLPLVVFLACFARSAVKIGLGRELAWRGRSLTGR
ncbi:glycosyltransferase [Acidiferrimicrobium sp. IK]|uniref:glycosyltransferase n=1 Tax=Acidiferrimicrobium sp. IK TaxID=2871700 RepID=UPI0021CB8D04|nr:glycosyltransferase [Acidiferrimicrobium sp. IK]MCU4186934.1 glycosyltransferase [Acidiferrimicrobium sp. IK]